MKKQKLNEQTPHKEVGVEKRRRFIKGAGLAAPVVLSLANRSAFGAAQGCLSQLVSGNMSQAGAGSCSLGSSVVSWNPTTPNIGTLKCNIALSTTQTTYPSVTATWGTGDNLYFLTATITQQQYSYNWFGTPYVYGILKTQTITLSLTKKGETQSGSFKFPTSGVTTNPLGSTLFTTLFPSGTANYPIATTYYTYTNNPTTGAFTKTSSAGMSGVGTLSATYFSDGTLCSTAFPKSSMPNTSMLANLSPSSSLNAYKVCALLNAVYNPTPTPNPPYALTVAQVLGLCKIPSTVSLPPNTTLAAFLASTLES